MSIKPGIKETGGGGGVFYWFDIRWSVTYTHVIIKAGVVEGHCVIVESKLSQIGDLVKYERDIRNTSKSCVVITENIDKLSYWIKDEIDRLKNNKNQLKLILIKCMIKKLGIREMIRKKYWERISQRFTIHVFLEMKFDRNQ